MMAQKIEFVLELVMASSLEYSFGSRVDFMLIQKKKIYNGICDGINVDSE